MKIPIEISRLQLTDIKKFNVIHYLMIDTNFTDKQYKGRNKFECTFSYTLLENVFKDMNLSRKKLQKIFDEIIQDGYFTVVKKGTKGNPTILKNMIAENTYGNICKYPMETPFRF